MNKPLVLCYHAISADWPAVLTVRIERFAEQLDLLCKRGYRPITFSEAAASPSHGKTFAITFDDAFASVLEHAFPLLSSRDIPATVFAVTSFADSGAPLKWKGIDQWTEGPHASELAGMNWEDLRRLADAGWEIGSHTVTHPHLTTLDDSRLTVELRESRAACEAAMGTRCSSIAYPYGDVDERVAAAAAAAGYSYGAALPSRLHRPLPMRWPRVGIWRDDDQRRFRLKVSPLVQAARIRLGR